MGPRNKAEPIDVLLHHIFGFLNAFGNFHFLLSGQERDLAHLLEIHPHRIVENIELGFGFLFLFFLFLRVFFPVLIPIDLRSLDNVDLHAAQSRQNEIQLVGIRDPFGQRLVQIVKCEIALFFRQFNQFANAGLDFNRRMQMCHRHFARRFRPRFAIASPSLSENDRLGPERGNFWLLLQAAAESGSLCY